MSKAVAWAVFVLGIAHIVFGIVRFKVPLAEAVSAGFIGQFREPEVRRTAFWFIMWALAHAGRAHSDPCSSKWRPLATQSHWHVRAYLIGRWHHGISKVAVVGATRAIGVAHRRRVWSASRRDRLALHGTFTARTRSCLLAYSARLR